MEIKVTASIGSAQFDNVETAVAFVKLSLKAFKEGALDITWEQEEKKGGKK